MQLLSVVARLILLLTLTLAKTSDDVCNTGITLENFKLEECLGTWYQYSGSEQCDHCCVIRNLELLKDGALNVTDTINIPSKAQRIVKSFIVKKEGENFTFNYGTESKSAIILDGKCDTYVSLKQLQGSKIQVFTRKINPLLVPETVKCNIPTFNYTPDEACLKFL